MVICFLRASPQPVRCQRLLGSVRGRFPFCLFVAGVLLGAGVRADERSLVDAAKAQDQQRVIELLKRGMDVNAQESDGTSALHWAAYHNDLAIVERLIRAGAHVDQADDQGVTPLIVASMGGNGSVVQLLLAAKAKPDARALPTQVTALMYAARSGSEDAVKALLLAGADANTRETAHGQTALMWAAARGHAGAARLLAESGANLRARALPTNIPVIRSSRYGANERTPVFTGDRNGFTPLLFAVRSGDRATTAVLIDAGADVNECSVDGVSPLTLAIHSGHGHLTSLLLERGADPNADAAGYAPLHAAVLRGDAASVRTLLSAGAKPDPVVSQGTEVRRFSRDFAISAEWRGATPLWLAARFLETEIVKTLLSAKAMPGIATADGTTVLMAATGVGKRGLRRGAPYDHDRRERLLNPSDIEQAINDLPQEQSRVLECLELLLPFNLDVNERRGDGSTAIYGAASNHYPRVIELLAQRGADVTVRNKRGETPLAAVQGRGERQKESPESIATVAMLKKMGAVD
jgi:ankyrin repeat protein